MTSGDVGWRAGAVVFIVLSLVSVAVGWTATQFDDQYAASSILGRMIVGVFVGLFGAGIVSPVSACIAAIVGAAAARHHQKKARSPQGPTATR